jgi:hypothetical protein
MPRRRLKTEEGSAGRSKLEFSVLTDRRTCVHEWKVENVIQSETRCDVRLASEPLVVNCSGATLGAPSLVLHPCTMVYLPLQQEKAKHISCLATVKSYQIVYNNKLKDDKTEIANSG